MSSAQPTKIKPAAKPVDAAVATATAQDNRNVPSGIGFLMAMMFVCILVQAWSAMNNDTRVRNLETLVVEMRAYVIRNGYVNPCHAKDLSCQMLEIMTLFDNKGAAEKHMGHWGVRWYDYNSAHQHQHDHVHVNAQTA